MPSAGIVISAEAKALCSVSTVAVTLLRGLVGDAHTWPSLGTVARGATVELDALLQFDEAVEQGVRGGRAAWHVHVDGHDLVDALDQGVVVEDPTARGTIAHGDDPLRLGHLVVNLTQHWRHLLRHPAGHDHEIRLAG